MIEFDLYCTALGTATAPSGMLGVQWDEVKNLAEPHGLAHALQDRRGISLDDHLPPLHRDLRAGHAAGFEELLVGLVPQQGAPILDEKRYVLRPCRDQGL